MNLFKKYYLKQKWEIIAIIALKTVATLVRLFIPWAFAYMTENVLNFGSEWEILRWGSYMIGFAIGSFVINLVVFQLNAKFVVKLSNTIRKDIFCKVNYLECNQMDEFGVSSITARLTSDISSVQMFSSKMMTKGIATITTFIGSIFAAGILDLKLTFVLFITIPLIIVTIYFTTKIGFKRFILTKKANDRLVKSIRENVMGIRVIRALSKFEYEEEKFDGISNELKTKNFNASIVDAVGSPTMKLLVNVGMVGTLVLGAILINAGVSNITSLIAFMSYFTMILTSLVGIGQLFTMYSKAGAAADRIQEVLEKEPNVYIEDTKEYESLYHIEFKNVTFGYLEGQEVLKNVSFKLKKGETLGVIGVTGVGKTTIMSLLLRLYEPDKGEILIDGKPINKISTENLYSMFGTVFQSDTIFSETISENIKFGRDLSTEEIQLAGKISQAESFILKLKNNYETRVNIRGQNISGGEKQRLLLARALSANPDILLLDDSTTALDYKTDALVRKELQERFNNTTKIIISSRVASIMNAEKIIVLDDGEICNVGTHDELVAKCEIYNKIRKLQLGDSKLYT